MRLESERNDQQRFIQLEYEIKRLKAIKVSEKLKEIINDITDFSNRNGIRENNIKIITNEINKLNQQIEQLNNEKEQFLILSNDSNKEKKEMETRLSSVIYQYERTNAIIKESQYYLNQTIQKENNNLLEQQIQYQKLKDYEEQLIHLKNKIEIGERNRGEIEEKLKEIAKEIEEKNELNLNEINRKNSLETRLKKLLRIKGEFEVNIARNEEKIKNLSDKIRINDKSIVEYLTERKANDKKISDLNVKIKEVYTNISKIKDNVYKIDIESTKLSRELEISKKTIDNAEKTILKYDEKMKLAKNILTEDYAIASLLKDFKNLDIIGYVFNLLKWDEKYQKAIIASGNEWMKSIVVKDIKSMITSSRIF